MTTTMTTTAKEALNRVLALRRITFENNVVTRRSQNVVLQALANEDLIEVAQRLEAHRAEHGW
jgi:hypothetical protein